MRKKYHRRKRRRRRLWRQQIMILFSLALLFSPFSSVGLAVFAEDNAATDDLTVEADTTEEILEESAENETANDEDGDLAESEETEETDDESDTSEESDAADQASSESPDGELETESDGDEVGEEDETGVEEGEEFAQEPAVVETKVMQAAGQVDIMQAENETTDGFKWVVNQDGDVTITGYTGNETDITIPDEIVGKTVVAIGDWSFQNKSLEAVEIPSSVKTIGEWAFQGNEIENLTLHDGLETISYKAFQSNELESVEIPGTVKNIGETAFLFNKINDLTLHEGLETISSSAFRENHLTSLKLPSTVRTIENLAFTDNKIQTLELNDGLKTIKWTAFSRNSIESLEIPASVETIEHFAFAYNDITELTLKEGLKKIDNDAFEGNYLTNVTIPASVDEIGVAPFAGNPLETIEIGENSKYTTINQKGLYTKNGDELIQGTKSVEIADGTEIIGYKAFAGLGLDGEDIHFPNSIEKIKGEAFASVDSGSDNKSVEKRNKLESVEIPNHIQFVGDAAFRSVGLQDLILHEGLEEIDENAFRDNLLTSIEIPSTVEEIKSGAFEKNHINQAIFQTKNVTIDNDILSRNQDDPTDLTIYGYKDYDVETFASGQGYTFVPFPHQLALDADEPYDFYSEEVIEITNSDGEVVGTIQMPPFDQTGTLPSARLLVRDVAEDDVTATGLEVAGQIVDILFVGWEYENFPDEPDEILNDEINELGAEFILSLRVKDDATGNIAMYHEVGDDWDHVGGDVTDGFITATVTDFSKYGVFSQIEEEPILIDIKVEKVWEGEQQDSVTIYLLANGDEDNSVILSESNNWKDTFLELPTVDTDGNEIVYTVAEEEIEGYETTITGSAEEGFVITNTEIVDEEEPIKPEDPETPEEPEKPEDPETPVEPDDPDKTPKPAPKEETPEKTAETLPKTATSTFNFMMIGMVLLLVGGTTYIYFNRRQRNVSEE